MPCRDDQAPVSPQNNEQAEMLCGVLKSLEDRGYRVNAFMDQKTAAWWEAHKTRDAERVQAEEQAKKAAAEKNFKARQTAILNLRDVLSRQVAGGEAWSQLVLSMPLHLRQHFGIA